MGQVADVITSICDLPSYFDIDTEVGEQLTFLGRRMGWPRCHCICTSQPVLALPVRSMSLGQPTPSLASAGDPDLGRLRPLHQLRNLHRRR